MIFGNEERIKAKEIAANKEEYEKRKVEAIKIINITPMSSILEQYLWFIRHTKEKQKEIIEQLGDGKVLWFTVRDTVDYFLQSIGIKVDKSFELDQEVTFDSKKHESIGPARNGETKVFIIGLPLTFTWQDPTGKVHKSPLKRFRVSPIENQSSKKDILSRGAFIKGS